jgi:hypothetical protein
MKLTRIYHLRAHQRHILKGTLPPVSHVKLKPLCAGTVGYSGNPQLMGLKMEGFALITNYTCKFQMTR